MKDYSFGNFISELRMRRGLSQYQLGTLVGVSNKAVSKWENGSAKPKISTCQKLAPVLGVSLDELLACKYQTSASAEKGIFAMKKELWKKAEQRLQEVYGSTPHINVFSRFETEKRILKKGNTIAHFMFLSNLTETARGEGTIPFIFGDINSSFIAWLLGITPVNPLDPHYLCPDCKSIEFHQDASDGWDLPEKNCSCGCRMIRDGHSIPGDQALVNLLANRWYTVNLPASFLPRAGRMLKEFFKDAAQIVKIELKNSGHLYPMLPPERYGVFQDDVFREDTLRITGEEFYKRFGDYPIYTFSASVSVDALRRLYIKTNHAPEKTDFLSDDVIQAYHAGKIPDFLDDANRSVLPLMRSFAPKHFSEILRVHGLHHATGAWENNGEILVQNGTAKRSEIIAFREEIYRNVLRRLPYADTAGTGLALKVMEFVQKGYYHKQGMPVSIEKMLIELRFPIWYIESMKKIRYLFPKGHAAAYLQVEMILVWYSIRYPKAFSSVMSAIHRDYRIQYEE